MIHVSAALSSVNSPGLAVGKNTSAVEMSAIIDANIRSMYVMFLKISFKSNHIG